MCCGFSLIFEGDTAADYVPIPIFVHIRRANFPTTYLTPVGGTFEVIQDDLFCVFTRSLILLMMVMRNLRITLLIPFTSTIVSGSFLSPEQVGSHFSVTFSAIRLIHLFLRGLDFHMKRISTSVLVMAVVDSLMLESLGPHTNLFEPLPMWWADNFHDVRSQIISACCLILRICLSFAGSPQSTQKNT